MIRTCEHNADILCAGLGKCFDCEHYQLKATQWDYETKWMLASPDTILRWGNEIPSISGEASGSVVDAQRMSQIREAAEQIVNAYLRMPEGMPGSIQYQHVLNDVMIRIARGEMLTIRDRDMLARLRMEPSYARPIFRMPNPPFEFNWDTGGRVPEFMTHKITEHPSVLQQCWGKIITKLHIQKLMKWAAKKWSMYPRRIKK